VNKKENIMRDKKFVSEKLSRYLHLSIIPAGRWRHYICI